MTSTDPTRAMHDPTTPMTSSDNWGTDGRRVNGPKRYPYTTTLSKRQESGSMTTGSTGEMSEAEKQKLMKPTVLNKVAPSALCSWHPLLNPNRDAEPIERKVWKRVNYAVDTRSYGHRML